MIGHRISADVHRKTKVVGAIAAPASRDRDKEGLIIVHFRAEPTGPRAAGLDFPDVPRPGLKCCLIESRSISSWGKINRKAPRDAGFNQPIYPRNSLQRSGPGLELNLRKNRSPGPSLLDPSFPRHEDDHKVKESSRVGLLLIVLQRARSQLTSAGEYNVAKSR